MPGASEDTRAVDRVTTRNPTQKGAPTMAKKLHKGDRVSWKSHGSTAVGKVRDKITKRTRAGGRTVDASPEEPQYLVESEKSGGTAVHKPEALKKRGKSK